MLPRRHKRRPPLPPAPRIDVIHDRAEQQLFDQTFAESLWRRASPR